MAQETNTVDVASFMNCQLLATIKCQRLFICQLCCDSDYFASVLCIILLWLVKLMLGAPNVAKEPAQGEGLVISC
jgi:hypothetical protein